MTCVVEGCDKRRKARGLCSTHYSRVLKSGELDQYPTVPHEKRFTGAEVAERFRQRHPDRAAINAQRNLARARSRTLLAKMYPDVAESLYIDECLNAGIEPYEVDPLPRGAASPSYEVNR